jgi:site-specific recombinase XerD
VAMRIQSHREERLPTRSPKVPGDFGDHMLAAAEKMALPTTARKNTELRKQRLNTLRTRALIHTLRASALRIGDVVTLTRSTLAAAHAAGGYLTITMEKTGLQAHIYLGEAARKAIESYIEERGDHSPFLFVQHGRSGKLRSGSANWFRVQQRGYGAPMGISLARSIVYQVARLAGYEVGTEKTFVGPHAFRHWHAQRLIDQGASLDQVQSVLGHANPETTKKIYATDPNVGNIIAAERALQEVDDS